MRRKRYMSMRITCAPYALADHSWVQQLANAHIPVPTGPVRKPGVDTRTSWMAKRKHYLDDLEIIPTVSVKGRAELGDRKVIADKKKEAQIGQAVQIKVVGMNECHFFI